MHAKRIEEPKVKLKVTMTKDEFDILKELHVFWNIKGNLDENTIALESRFEFPDTNIRKIGKVLSDLFEAFYDCKE